VARPLGRLALLIVAASVFFGYGCGASAGDRATTTKDVARSAVRAPAAGTAASAATVRTATCLLWSVEDRSGRNRLLLGLREFFGQRLDNGAHFRLIPDTRAYRIITHYCSLPFAKAFLIYRLYADATAFAHQ